MLWGWNFGWGAVVTASVCLSLLGLNAALLYAKLLPYLVFLGVSCMSQTALTGGYRQVWWHTTDLLGTSSATSMFLLWAD